MKRGLATALITAAVVALVFPLALPLLAASVEGDVSRVTLVLVPGLRWEDITPTATPTLARLVAEGAVGDINARSRTRLQGIPASPLEGALTMSAGAWASPVEGAPGAYSLDERYEGGSAAEAYRRIMGHGAGDARIAFLGLPMTQRFNDELSFEVKLGTLGQAIEDAGGSTAALGNSDAGTVGAYERVRPAALAAMDDDGAVRFGDVSSRMLREDPNAPYGVTTDIDALKSALSELDRRLGSSKQPHLTVVDAGDTYRAARIAPVVSDSVAQAHRARAFEVVDEVVAATEEALPPDGVLIVASQIPGTETEAVEGLGPILVNGEGWCGYLTSSSTHRKGIVTNLDVTATVLDVLGLESPLNVVGNPMASDGSPADDSVRTKFLSRLNATAVAVESAKMAIINSYIAFTVIVVVIATLVLMRIRRWGDALAHRWSLALRTLLLLILAVPPASWLMFFVFRWPESVAQAQLAFAAVVVAIWSIACLLQVRTAPRAALAFASLLTAAVMLVDQWLGAPLSYNSFFGYSPLLGARFYGMGNESAAALLGSTLVGLACIFDQWPDAKLTKVGRAWGLPIVGLVAVGTAAAPFLGANVGVIAWGLVGFGIAWAQMNGHRIGWRFAVLALLIVALSVAAFSVIDLFGGGPQTHLGRALTSASKGGGTELLVIVARKAQTNLRVLTHTNWVYVLIAVLAFLGFMRWRPQGDFASTLRANPHFSSAMSACLIAGVTAFFTEDSGIVIPAIMLLWVGVGALYLMLARVPQVAGGASPDEVAAAYGGPDRAELA